MKLTPEQQQADADHLRERVTYWDTRLTELYEHHGIKPLMSTVVSMLANHDQGERWRAMHDAAPKVEAEPVAWMDDFGNAFPLAANKRAGSWLDEHKRNWTPLYTRPAATQPAGEVVVTKNESGQIVAVTRQDEEGRILSVIAESDAPQPDVRLEDDDALRFACRVLDSGSLPPESDKAAARAGLEKIRTRLRTHPAAPQPAGEVVVTKNESSHIVAVTRQDEEGRILSVIAESDAPHPAALPELSDAEIQAVWDSVFMLFPQGEATRNAFARAVIEALKGKQ